MRRRPTAASISCVFETNNNRRRRRRQRQRRRQPNEHQINEFDAAADADADADADAETGDNQTNRAIISDEVFGGSQARPSERSPGWQIKEQMAKLEKDIVQLDKHMEEARSISLMEEARSISLMEEAALNKRLYSQQMKRPRLSDMEMPPTASSSNSPVYRDRSFPSHRDGDADEISALVSSYLGQVSGFPHQSSLMRSPEYMVPPGGLGRSVSAYDHMKIAVC
ncbi:hypothetical protein Rs2_40371 [Raphanus sativus]|nr:hypothetical protein Rs2_40371 [Raphanus sativus]